MRSNMGAQCQLEGPPLQRAGILASSTALRQPTQPHASMDEQQMSGYSRPAPLQIPALDASPPFPCHRLDEPDVRCQPHIAHTSHVPMASTGAFPLCSWTGAASAVQVSSPVQTADPSPCKCPDPHGLMLAGVEVLRCSEDSLSCCPIYRSGMSKHELDIDSAGTGLTTDGDCKVELQKASVPDPESYDLQKAQAGSLLPRSLGHGRQTESEGGSRPLPTRLAQGQGSSPSVSGNVGVQNGSELLIASREAAQVTGWASWNRHEVREPGGAPLLDPDLRGETTLQPQRKGEQLPIGPVAQADGGVHSAALEWAEGGDALVAKQGLAERLGVGGVSERPSTLQHCVGRRETEAISSEAAADGSGMLQSRPASLSPLCQEGTVSIASVNRAVKVEPPVVPLTAASSRDTGDCCTGDTEESQSLPEQPAGSAGQSGGVACSTSQDLRTSQSSALQRLAQRRMQQRLSSVSRPASPASLAEGSLSFSINATSMQGATAGNRGREEWACRPPAGSRGTSPRPRSSGQHPRDRTRSCLRPHLSVIAAPVKPFSHSFFPST